MYAIRLNTPFGVRFAVHSRDDGSDAEGELATDIHAPDVLLYPERDDALADVAAGCWRTPALVVRVADALCGVCGSTVGGECEHCPCPVR